MDTAEQLERDAEPLGDPRPPALQEPPPQLEPACRHSPNPPAATARTRAKSVDRVVAARSTAKKARRGHEPT